jgi:hypothetical protein
MITSPLELTRENFTLLGYIRRMKYTVDTKELMPAYGYEGRNRRGLRGKADG